MKKNLNASERHAIWQSIRGFIGACIGWFIGGTISIHILGSSVGSGSWFIGSILGIIIGCIIALEIGQKRKAKEIRNANDLIIACDEAIENSRWKDVINYSKKLALIFKSEGMKREECLYYRYVGDAYVKLGYHEKAFKWYKKMIDANCKKEIAKMMGKDFDSFMKIMKNQ